MTVEASSYDTDLTFGIEEEFQIIDPETGELHPDAGAMFSTEALHELPELQQAVRREIHQPVVEVATGICRGAAEAARQVRDLRRAAARHARANGARIVAASTNPITHWKNVDIHQSEHYDNLVERFQDVARGNLVFGLHVHIGIADPDERIAVMNETARYLPQLLALSANSPFWCGRDSGWDSFRSKVFDRYPRTGIPPYFVSDAEFQEYVGTLVRTGSIRDGRSIWWDIRPHPYYPTLEYRVTDIPSTAAETVLIAALIQALAAATLDDVRNGLRVSRTRPQIIQENKQRAARYGMRALMICPDTLEQHTPEQWIEQLLDRALPFGQKLGSREELVRIESFVSGNGADRQRTLIRESGSSVEMMRTLADITEEMTSATASS